MTRYEIQDVMTPVSAISVYGLCNENMEKHPWEESFFLSEFWSFGAFSENFFNPWQRASVRVSTVTRPQTIARGTAATISAALWHSQTLIKPRTQGGLGVGKKISPPTAALGCKPCIPHTSHYPQLSSAHLLVPSSHPRTARCQQMLLAGYPRTEHPCEQQQWNQAQLHPWQAPAVSNVHFITRTDRARLKHCPCPTTLCF